MHTHLLAYADGRLVDDRGAYRRRTAACAALARVVPTTVPVARPSPREASWTNSVGTTWHLLVMTCVGVDCAGFLDPPFGAAPEEAE